MTLKDEDSNPSVRGRGVMTEIELPAHSPFPFTSDVQNLYYGTTGPSNVMCFRWSDAYVHVQVD